MVRLFISLVLVLDTFSTNSAFGQTLIRNLPASGTILDATTFVIDDATYGVRGFRMTNFVEMVKNVAATNPATPVAGVLYGVQVVDTAAALTNLNTIYYTNAITMGRNSKGDGGGGRWYFVTNASSAHVNSGTVWRNSANNGNWYWDLAQTANTIPLALFPGILGAGATEIDVGLRAAILFCGAPTYGPITGSTTNRYQLGFPPGEFVVNSVTNIYGVNLVGSQSAALTRIGGKTTTQLTHKSGATGPLYTISGYSASIKGFSIRGMAEANAQGKVPITAVASRTSFSVSAPNLPLLVDVNNAFAFFFAPGGEFLGSGLVSGASGTTVTLVTGSDLYAAPGGSLTTDMLVSFTRNVTSYLQDGTEVVAPGPAVRGWPAIVLSHDTNGPGYTQPMIVEDCVIHNFHTGIVRANTVQPIIRNTKIANCHFAGIANLVATYGSDGQISDVDIQGQYGADIYFTDTASGYANQAYRNQMFGIWSGGEHDRYSQILIEYCTTGVYLAANQVSFDHGVMDQIYRWGFYSGYGVGTKVSGFTFYARGALHTNSALFRLIGSSSLSTWDISHISCPVGAPYQYAYGIDNEGGSTHIIASGIENVNGLVNWRNTNNPAGSHPILSQTINDALILQSMYNGIKDDGEYGMSFLAANNVRQRFWKDGHTIFGKDIAYGLNIGVDMKTSVVKFGADSAYEGVFQSQRTTNAGKALALMAPTWLDGNQYLSTNHYVFAATSAGSGSSTVTLGGGTVNALAANKVWLAASPTADTVYSTDHRVAVVDPDTFSLLKGFAAKFVTSSTTNYTIGTNDYGVCYTGTTSTAWTLPAASSLVAGQLFSLINQGTSSVILSTNFITGYTTSTNAVHPGERVRIWSDGTYYRREM